MSSKKRKKPNPFYHRPDSYGNRTSYSNSPNMNRDPARGYFICDICGSNVPGMGGAVPICPRCTIPMQPMDGMNPNARKSGPAKPAYDYTSRIYFQTDGHPQYIGLPMGHPDPDDEAAVSAYHARREADRVEKRKQIPMDYRQRNQNPFRNRHSHHPQQNRPNYDRQSNRPPQSHQHHNVSRPTQPPHHSHERTSRPLDSNHPRSETQPRPAVPAAPPNVLAPVTNPPVIEPKKEIPAPISPPPQIDSVQVQVKSTDINITENKTKPARPVKKQLTSTPRKKPAAAKSAKTVQPEISDKSKQTQQAPTKPVVKRTVRKKKPVETSSPPDLFPEKPM